MLRVLLVGTGAWTLLSLLLMLIWIALHGPQGNLAGDGHKTFDLDRSG
jgi:hypothetical protein